MEIDISEHYIKQSLRNRYQVLGVNGIMALTIPVEGQKGKKIELQYIKTVGSAWQRTHLSAIKAAYGRAAYFEHVIDDLQVLYNSQFTFLYEFSIASIELFLRHSEVFHYTLNTTATGNPSTSEEFQFSLTLEPSYSHAMLPEYPQVFSDRFPFMNNLSALDLLMNMGPKTETYLQSMES